MTKYTAICVRSGNWWAISVPEIRGVHSQARRLDKVEAMAREAIALMLDVKPNSFEVEVRPEVPSVVARARQARAAQRQAEQSAEAATLNAARELLGKGYTVRDAGALLGISPQRISQLTGKATVRKAAPRRSAKSAQSTKPAKRTIAA